ncbi:MAG: hypothetical protein JWQ20_1761 [Conexibacter sp.]|nr:hypothetical protein [Conexibacter sp.]
MPTTGTGDGAAAGKAARARAPRSSHGSWTPAPDRRDPRAVLREQDAGHVKELVPIRYGRMLTSPFTFFRGAAGIMAGDLTGTPVSGFDVQLCGDAHLSNFGAFAAPDRRLVFDVNDFDETQRGPWEWDVKRLAASVAIAGRAQGFREGERRTAVLAALRRYRKAMRALAAMGHLDVWYSRIDLEDVLQQVSGRLGARGRKRLARNVEKARGRDSTRALGKLTVEVDGQRRIRSDPPLIVRAEDLLPADDERDVAQTLSGLLGVYRDSLEPDRQRLLDGYRSVDLARKVVGVGSVGTRAWVVLLVGRDADDPLVLQVKEAEPSALEPHLGPSGYDNQGRRVVEGQRLMQAAGDILLGWLSARGLDGVHRDFYVRQLWDGKGSATIEELEPEQLAAYAGLCGRTLARAHARSGDRAAIAAYLGSGRRFDDAVADFAERYADQNERDYEVLTTAAREGSVAARSGV